MEAVDAVEAVALFRDHLQRNPALVELAKRELAGFDLGRTCPLDQPCHADVWLDVANQHSPGASYVAQQWQHKGRSINSMAKYGERSEAKISTINPRQLKPWVYAIAAVVGLTGGILGLVGAPFALWAINRNGPVVIGKNTVGIWAQWIAAGVLLSPILLAISVIRPPQTTTTRQLSADEVTLDLVHAKLKETAFTPGVVGRKNSESCQTTSKACQIWTALAIGCEANLKRRFEGFNGKFLQDYCGKAEDLREKATGVELSTEPNAFSF